MSEYSSKCFVQVAVFKLKDFVVVFKTVLCVVSPNLKIRTFVNPEK